jgi:hypothetical protein
MTVSPLSVFAAFAISDALTTVPLEKEGVDPLIAPIGVVIFVICSVAIFTPAAGVVVY